MNGYVVMRNNIESVNLFNNPVELGARITLLLAVLGDRKLDLDQLIYFDYISLYSSEFSGPESIHPAVPNHIAEILYRRECLPGALHLFASKGLLSVTIDDTGYSYGASEQALPFAAALQSSYYKKLWTNLLWVDNNFDELNQSRKEFFCRVGVTE